MDMQTLALFFLVTVAAGGVVWVFVYPILSGERKAEKRMEIVARADAGLAHGRRSAAPSARAANRWRTASRSWSSARSRPSGRRCRSASTRRA